MKYHKYIYKKKLIPTAHFFAIFLFEIFLSSI